MKAYNIITLDISNGLEKYECGTGGGYIVLISADPRANVSIALNDNDADDIPVKPYHGITASNVTKLYVSCNAVLGEKIKILQASSIKEVALLYTSSPTDFERSINKYYSSQVAGQGFISTTHQDQKSFNVPSDIDKVRVHVGGYSPCSNGALLHNGVISVLALNGSERPQTVCFRLGQDQGGFTFDFDTCSIIMILGSVSHTDASMNYKVEYLKEL